MTIEEKAERLHALGHEVAAAALRRSAMWDKGDIHSFQAIPMRRNPVDSYGRVGTPGTPKWLQPGRVRTHSEHDTEGRLGTGNIFNALRVGKTVGPVTAEELRSLGHRGEFPRRLIMGLDHPLASGGHGLHSSDPHHMSFKLLQHHIDDPSVWPMISDHFEEHGGHRAAAMARLLRRPVAKSTGWLNEAVRASPVTHPVGVWLRGTRRSSDPQNPMEKVFEVHQHRNGSSHHIVVPDNEATEILHALRS